MLVVEVVGVVVVVVALAAYGHGVVAPDVEGLFAERGHAEGAGQGHAVAPEALLPVPHPADLGVHLHGHAETS